MLGSTPAMTWHKKKLEYYVLKLSSHVGFENVQMYIWASLSQFKAFSFVIWESVDGEGNARVMGGNGLR